MLLGSCSHPHQLGMDANPQEILDMKLADPDLELSTQQSVSLINHCAKLGEHNAAPAAGKEVVMVLGNAGVGKSTFLNYLLGCKMEEDTDESGAEDIIKVHTESDIEEIMPIGHGRTSRTFMPQIAQESSKINRAYCDCPGFSDNRGPEINIANSLNINRVLQQATGVKAIFLTSYYGISEDRGSSIEAMENICRQMFGGIDNLKRYQSAVLLGITKAPLQNRRGQPLSLNMVRSRLTQANTPTAQILANRIFLYDPLDRGGEDFWSRNRCRTEIAQLKNIPLSEATALFQTVLTDNDQTKLKHIMRNQATALAEALERDDYDAAGTHWQTLTLLRIIGNDEVEKMLGEHALAKIHHYVLGCVGAFKEYALQHQFDEAERQLALLRMLTRHFPHADLKVSLEELELLLAQCREKKAEEQKNTDERLAAEKHQAVRDVREEMEKKLEQLEAQLKANKQNQNITINLDFSF